MRFFAQIKIHYVLKSLSEIQKGFLIQYYLLPTWRLR